MKRMSLIAVISLLVLGAALVLCSPRRDAVADGETPVPPAPAVAQPTPPLVQSPAPTAQAARTTLPTDACIVFHWGFDGNLNEDKHADLTGTGTNVTFAPGRGSDQACVFNGTNSLVSVPHHDGFSLLQTFSVSAWVHLKAKKTQYIFLKGAALRDQESPISLACSATGDAIFSVHREGTGYGEDARLTGYALGRWIHLAGVFNGSVIRLYVDGKQVAEESCAGVPHTNTDPFLIGSRLGLPADTVDGMVDDLTVFNRALTAQEVAAEFTRK